MICDDHCLFHGRFTWLPVRRSDAETHKVIVLIDSEHSAQAPQCGACWCTRLLFRLRVLHKLHGLGGVEDVDTLPRMQHQQIAVAGDDQLCASGKYTSDDLIVVDVVGHRAGCG